MSTPSRRPPRELARQGGREADDDRGRGRGKQDVVLGDRANAAMDHVDLDFGGRELGQLVSQRFHGAAHVPFRITFRRSISPAWTWA